MVTSLKKSKYEKYSKAILPYLKKEKNQKYLSAFLTIGASIFFILFAINPTISTIVKLRKEISDNKLLDKALTQKINNLSALNSSYEDIKADIPLIEDALPRKPDAPILVAQIQKLAQDSGLSIDSVTVSPMNLIVGNSTKSSSFEFSITVGGQYNDFSRFLDYLITMQRALTVSSVLITENESQSHIVSGVIKGSAYFKK